jgi:hypothetical protein
MAGLGAAGWPPLVSAQQQTKPIIAWLDLRLGGPCANGSRGFAN